MELFQRIDAYLAEEVESAEERLDLRLSPHSKMYLLHLLKDLSSNANLFQAGVLKERALCVVLIEALHKDVFGKIRDLRVVGDLALLFTGFFPEFLTRRLVDIDYFAVLGRTSYHLLSETYGGYRTKQELCFLYSQLVSEFFCLVKILTELSAAMHFLNDGNLGKACRRWRATGVQRYRDILIEHGVTPI